MERIVVASSRSGVELETAPKRVSESATTGNKGERMNQHEQQYELTSDDEDQEETETHNYVGTDWDWYETNKQNNDPRSSS